MRHPPDILEDTGYSDPHDLSLVLQPSILAVVVVIVEVNVVVELVLVEVMLAEELPAGGHATGGDHGGEPCTNIGGYSGYRY